MLSSTIYHYLWYNHIYIFLLGTNLFEVLLLAIGLSMDSFAVAIAIGIKEKKFDKILALKVALIFGFFQGFMPLIGYFLSLTVSDMIDSFDHIIAFLLLLAIGGKMLYESYQDGDKEEIKELTLVSLAILGIATSIDAMAVGFTLDLLPLDPYISTIVIGIVTVCFSYFGVYMGTRGSEYLENWAEKIGGLVLIAIGFKILIEN